MQTLLGQYRNLSIFIPWTIFVVAMSFIGPIQYFATLEFNSSIVASISLACVSMIGLLAYWVVTSSTTEGAWRDNIINASVIAAVWPSLVLLWTAVMKWKDDKWRLPEWPNLVDNFDASQDDWVAEGKTSKLGSLADRAGINSDEAAFVGYACSSLLASAYNVLCCTCCYSSSSGSAGDADDAGGDVGIEKGGRFCCGYGFVVSCFIVTQCILWSMAILLFVLMPGENVPFLLLAMNFTILGVGAVAVKWISNGYRLPSFWIAGIKTIFGLAIIVGFSLAIVTTEADSFNAVTVSFVLLGLPEVFSIYAWENEEHAQRLAFGEADADSGLFGGALVDTLSMSQRHSDSSGGIIVNSASGTVFPVLRVMTRKAQHFGSKDTVEITDVTYSSGCWHACIFTFYVVVWVSYACLTLEPANVQMATFALCLWLCFFYSYLQDVTYRAQRSFHVRRRRTSPSFLAPFPPLPNQFITTTLSFDNNKTHTHTHTPPQYSCASLTSLGASKTTLMLDVAPASDEDGAFVLSKSDAVLSSLRDVLVEARAQAVAGLLAEVEGQGLGDEDQDDGVGFGIDSSSSQQSTAGGALCGLGDGGGDEARQRAKGPNFQFVEPRVTKSTLGAEGVDPIVALADFLCVTEGGVRSRQLDEAWASSGRGRASNSLSDGDETPTRIDSQTFDVDADGDVDGEDESHIRFVWEAGVSQSSAAISKRAAQAAGQVENELSCLTMLGCGGQSGGDEVLPRDGDDGKWVGRKGGREGGTDGAFPN